MQQDKYKIIKYKNRKLYSLKHKSYINSTFLFKEYGNYIVVDKETKLDITVDTLLSHCATRFSENYCKYSNSDKQEVISKILKLVEST